MSGWGSWTDKFEPARGAGGAAGVPPPMAEDERDEDALALDLAEYKPWTVQRGRSRPAMMLELRRFDQRSGLWIGWQLSYPSLVAVEYVGDRLLTLDFGTRLFALEGQTLTELARHLQQGAVLAVQEYAASVWPARPAGPIISAIRNLSATDPSLR